MEGIDRVAVVGVVVVHEPGDWFDDTLAAFAAQDYPNLRWLFLVSDGEQDVLAARIDSALPDAIVRPVTGAAGFAVAADTVLDLVEGDNGLFWFNHDDVAPDPGALTALVEEFHRSNAGIVGPKLVDWRSPERLQSVGYGLDRIGEVDDPIEVGEIDQEQHDAVRDVFVVRSASLLVRADLFRSLGGFERSLGRLGEDVDLCWRAHWAGSRVVVAPEARVRHLAAGGEHRPVPGRAREEARRRVDTVLALTGPGRVPLRWFEMFLVGVVEALVGVFTGRADSARLSLVALLTAPARLGSILRRRRSLSAVRQVSDEEVIGLQNRGSARLTAYLRSRDTTTLAVGDTTVRRWRGSTAGPALAWVLIVLGLVVGSRSLITGGVPPVGGLLPVPDGRFELLGAWWSSWDPRGVGSTVAVPGGWALIGLLDTVLLSREGAVGLLLVVAPVLVGLLGVQHLVTVFPASRARVVALTVYAASPVLGLLIGHGEWDGLIVYAALPWVIHLGRRLAGIIVADPSTLEGDLVDGLAPPGPGERRRIMAALVLVTAVGSSLAPVTALVATVALMLTAVATVAVRGAWRTAGWFALAGLSGPAAFAMNLPWSTTWRVEGVLGVTGVAPSADGLARTLALGDPGSSLALLGLGLHLPVLAAVAIARAWRLTWAVRGAVLGAVGAALLVLDDRGALPFGVPGRAVLVVPVLLGLALCAASVAGGFGSDVSTRDFGWRQPLAVAANLGIVVGLVPGVLAIGSGTWAMPRNPLPELAASQFPPQSAVGSYRVLWVGDPRVLPVPGQRLVDGVGMAVTDAGSLGVTAAFPVAEGEVSERIRSALGHVAAGTTARAGRLLAPLGIRFIVVPLADDVDSTIADPLPPPAGLVDALGAQIDIGAVQSPPTIEVFVNRSWIPPAAFLTGPAADASRLAGESSLITAGLDGTSTIVDDRGAVVDLVDVVARSGSTTAVVPSAGVLHLGVPFDRSWRVRHEGLELEGRAGFGITTAFDVPGPGTLEVAYDPPVTRPLALVLVAGLWVVAFMGLTRRDPAGRLRRGGEAGTVEPVAALDLTVMPPGGRP
ncbi:MAG: glycosyltransferase [Ilumatobacteraceae bacterium]